MTVKYKEKNVTYLIEELIYIENMQNTAIIYGFDNYYIPGILDKKNSERLYKAKIKDEIKRLPINLQKGLMSLL